MYNGLEIPSKVSQTSQTLFYKKKGDGMDFYTIKEIPGKKGKINVAPSFLVGTSNDLMVRGKAFYAIWDESSKLWSTDEFDVQRIVDESIDDYIVERKKHNGDVEYVPMHMRTFKTNSWKEYRAFISHMPDTAKELDKKLVFLNDETKKTDYASKRLPYDIKEGSIEYYDELMSVLFSPEEREKLEWAVGSIFAGDSRHIQKFIILYGEGGTGKSTFLNILQDLFEGYYVAFDAKSLTGNNNAFSMEVFKSNPLVGIQHDGDLSKIADNTRLNSIVSHERMTVNEKFKSAYTTKTSTFLFMGTNTPVKITDSRSGIIRRLIDVYPTGKTFPPKKYYELIDGISFELGAIAYHCLGVYLRLGKNYYNSYKPIGMMYKTDVFYNFVEDNYVLFSEEDEVTLKRAYELYKLYCDESGLQHRLAKYKFKSELGSYFKTFKTRVRDADGTQRRNVYIGFIKERFVVAAPVIDSEDDNTPISLVLDSKESIFDKEYSNAPAQYSVSPGRPKYKWANSSTHLSDIKTTRLHFVRLPMNHIVIDFDLKVNGKKSREKNLEAASIWPPTYAEFSKSGAGVHLHYIYDGDPHKLAPLYSEGIEVKVFKGEASLRRKLTKCNNRPIAHISSGLPLKKEKKKVVDIKAVKSERSLKDLIERNLNKEFHPGTKPSIDFIYKILEDAYRSDLHYDLRSLRPSVLSFAMKSTNHADYCIKLVSDMKFMSLDPSEPISDTDDGDLVFFDVEVFPNLFVVVWKIRGEKNKPVRMINPTAKEVEQLFSMKLVGFNNRRYDNHILYAAWLGYTNPQLQELSNRIIGSKIGGTFREAYNISHTDIYDFSSKKQSLKKFEIELGIHHLELGLPWGEPVPEDQWDKVAIYCENDVIATEKVFEARQQDYVARLILSKLSGLTPNNTTQQHTAKIIFGNDPNPRSKFVYTDLSKEFPGYTFDQFRKPKSLYLGDEPSEGGYVYAEPGIYHDVLVLDVASEHPTSLIKLNLFGPYTKKYKELLDARLAIKHNDFDKAKKMLGGVLEPYLKDEKSAKELSYALKIVINIVYGLTSAKFENKFNDPRNKDNIVAKRGALFMIKLKQAVQKRGFKVVHIKTDSIKIPSPTEDIIKFVIDFGKKYGYDFEVEDDYERFCLVNNAVYIARKRGGKWTATGAQFAHPYVFKDLFTKEDISFEDLCETRAVKTSMYLDFNEGLPEGEHNYSYVGKVGLFVPVIAGSGGGELLREKDGKYYAVTRTKGYRWMEAEAFKAGEKEDIIDMSYYKKLSSDAVKAIEKFGSFEDFVS